MDIQFTILCNECGKELDAHQRGDEINVDPCPDCVEKLKDERDDALNEKNELERKNEELEEEIESLKLEISEIENRLSES